MALDALIFDLDGTLVDTNAAHVESWVRVLARHGRPIDADRIAPEIGKGGDMLVPSVLGRTADAKIGEALRHEVGEEFVRIVRDERKVKVFPRAVELLAAVRARGIRTALATSSGEVQLAATFESAGVDLREHVDAVVMKDDVEHSKPSPDVILAALAKLALTPAQCAMVGDTPHDAESARAAGVVTLGITAGGFNDAASLLAAGARRTWRDPAHLLSELDEALRLASPGRAHWNRPMLEGLMREALAIADEGVAAGEFPVGCVVADGEGTVHARAHAERARTGRATAHAELLALERLDGAVARASRGELVVVSTMEPCVMCVGAAMIAAADTVVYALPRPEAGGTRRVAIAPGDDAQMPRFVGGVLPDESRRLLERWLAANGTAPDAESVRRLVGTGRPGRIR